MRAVILAVGSELLGNDRIDTNSLRLAEALQRYGVALLRKAVVGDQTQVLAQELRRAAEEAGLVLVTGGLGPTADDVTRQAAAAALGCRLIHSEQVLEDIRAKFARFRMPMPEVNRRQAEILEGCEVLPNRRGTAPGLKVERDGCTFFFFPGVPKELEGLIESALKPWLEAHADGGRLETRVLRVACVAESALEERIDPIYRELKGEGLSVLSGAGDIQIRISAGGLEEERRLRLDLLSSRLSQLLGDAVYSFEIEDSLEAVVGRELRAAGATVAAAESCTGGLIAERLTDAAGSSDYFQGALVTYSDRLKSELLGVPQALLEEHGAVSEPVVRAMALGVRDRLEVDYGIGVSGIAGPGGGTEEKPVGTVHVAVAGPADGDCAHRRLILPGDRARVRRLTSQWALDMLRRRLLEVGGGSSDGEGG